MPIGGAPFDRERGRRLAIEADIAAWVARSDLAGLPGDVRQLAVTGIRDCVGVTLAGSDSVPARAVRDVVDLLGGHKQASVLGTPTRTSLTQAALANGTAAHALDFDDTNHPLYGHPSCHLVPALFALAEWTGAPGREFLTAYLVGFELEVRIARAVNIAHYAVGWHATATLGTLGTAAAASRLLALPPELTANALGIAVSLAGGLRENFGTGTKPLHAGLTAERGVQAALLARSGVTSAATALTGRFGFCAVLGGGEAPNLEELDPARFGNPWEIAEPHGLAIKQYPSCGATHPAIEAAIEAAGRPLAPPEIRRVRVGTTELAPQVLVHSRPRTGLEAKFSLEHCVAVALLEGRVGLDHFDDAAAHRADVQAVLPRVEPYIDERIRADSEYAAIVQLELTDGSERTARVDVARGKVARPLSHEQLLIKYEACAGRVLASEDITRSLELFGRLDELATIRELVGALVTPSDRSPTDVEKPSAASRCALDARTGAGA
jgi:2-methylcitrate dehydratase PrpD